MTDDLNEDQVVVWLAYPWAKCVPWAMDQFAITTEVPTDPDLVSTWQYGPISTKLVSVAESVEEAWSRARQKVQVADGTPQ